MAKKVKKNSGEMDVAKSVRDSQVEVVGIDEIVAYETNPRIHEDLQVEKVANSICSGSWHRSSWTRTTSSSRGTGAMLPRGCSG